MIVEYIDNFGIIRKKLVEPQPRCDSEKTSKLFNGFIK